METEEEPLLCAAGCLPLDSSDTESAHEIEEDPKAYECATVLVAGSMMININASTPESNIHQLYK